MADVFDAYKEKKTSHEISKVDFWTPVLYKSAKVEEQRGLEARSSSKSLSTRSNGSVAAGDPSSGTATAAAAAAATPLPVFDNNFTPGSFETSVKSPTSRSPGGGGTRMDSAAFGRDVEQSWATSASAVAGTSGESVSAMEMISERDRDVSAEDIKRLVGAIVDKPIP